MQYLKKPENSDQLKQELLTYTNPVSGNQENRGIIFKDQSGETSQVRDMEPGDFHPKYYDDTTVTRGEALYAIDRAQRYFNQLEDFNMESSLLARALERIKPFFSQIQKGIDEIVSPKLTEETPNTIVESPHAILQSQQHGSHSTRTTDNPYLDQQDRILGVSDSFTNNPQSIYNEEYTASDSQENNDHEILSKIQKWDLIMLEIRRGDLIRKRGSANTNDITRKESARMVKVFDKFIDYHKKQFPIDMSNDILNLFKDVIKRYNSYQSSTRSTIEEFRFGSN
jgi:hypothetical protein